MRVLPSICNQNGFRLLLFYGFELVIIYVGTNANEINRLFNDRCDAAAHQDACHGTFRVNGFKHDKVGARSSL